jgi:hypothetical protein
MASFEKHLDRLAAADRWTYRASEHSASEPAAWAALALAAHGRLDEAIRPANWLAKIQQADGSVGISEAEKEPRWPTSLALWAWSILNKSTDAARFGSNREAAIAWSVQDQGKTAPRSPQVGHDTELVGWSWAAATHSWLEPSCFFVLGLREAGQGEHPRVREGVRLIVDRLLPGGGANYGNTIVLGQPLVPHVQPTGIAMLAVAGEVNSDERVGRSLDYLQRTIGQGTAPASLAFAVLGLSAHGRRPAECDQWIAAALDESKRGPLAVYEQSLLLLAAKPEGSVRSTQEGPKA